MDTLIIGLGNPILTDDGVGVHIANAVEEKLPSTLSKKVTVTEASVGGLRLMEMMAGYEKVILVDAIITSNGAKPGEFHRLTLEDLRSISPTQHSASAHDTSLVTALEAGRLLGLQLPDEIEIFAVEVENVMDFSDVPTPAVASAIPLVTKTIIDELMHTSNNKYLRN